VLSDNTFARGILAHQVEALSLDSISYLCTCALEFFTAVLLATHKDSEAKVI